jgi:type VI protein secretion system component VasK
MEPPLPEIIFWRLLLVAVPFAVWFVWGAWAKRTGRPMGSTPWAWLATIGLVLVGLSLVGTAIFHPDRRHVTYVPGQVRSDGSVSKGYFENTPPAPKNAR